MGEDARPRHRGEERDAREAPPRDGHEEAELRAHAPRSRRGAAGAVVYYLKSADNSQAHTALACPQLAGISTSRY